MTADDIKTQLAQVKYPGFSRDIVSFGLVRETAFIAESGTAKVSLALTTSDPQVPLQIKAAVEQQLRALPGVRETIVDLAVTSVKTPAPSPGGSAGAAGGNLAGGAQLPAGIAHAVAIASGKGGVGKSTIAVNLACAAAQVLAARHTATGDAQAAAATTTAPRIGLMDCDIYGPSIPLMMGLSGRPEIKGEGAAAQIIPMQHHGVKVMSMGFLVDDNTPVVWRGPMIMKTVQQFVQNVDWGELDLLLIDLPPGTGDAQLSLVQTIPLDGAILVTTPQTAATQVARKGGLMFQKVNVPLLGVAENMSAFVDPAGQEHALFGSGGGAATAEQLGTVLLGKVPLLPGIREGGDLGQPIVVREPKSHAAQLFRNLAEGLLEGLKKR